jgi:uncharacterized membrane protein
MKFLRDFVTTAFVGGALVVLPLYLAVLLLLKGMQALVGLVRPVAALLPEWMAAENLLALLLLLIVCFVVGAAMRTPFGRNIKGRMEVAFFGKIPGYTTIRGLTQRLAGEAGDAVWKPALAEIEDALVPAFIIEEHDDDRYTIFVPSVPTPFAGAVYILIRSRVHPIDVPFKQALQAISKWGSGSKELVIAMKAADARRMAALKVADSEVRA